MQETQVRYLSQEDPLEKEMATYSSILALEIHEQRKLVVTVHGAAKSWTELPDSMTTHKGTIVDVECSREESGEAELNILR